MSVSFEETSPTLAANLKLSILFWASEQLSLLSSTTDLLSIRPSGRVDAREKRDIPLKHVETCR